MVLMRALALSALLIGVGLTGCLGQNGGDGDEQLKLKNRAEVTDKSGGIQGVVTDPTITPIDGAVLTILETSARATTASDGSYAFSNVIPGTYTVSVEAEEFIATELPIEIVPGRVTTLDVILTRLPSIQPYLQQLEFTGFVECSVRAGVGFAACGAVNSIGGGNITNDRFLFTWPVEADPWQIIAEIEWVPNQPTSAELSWIVEPSGLPNEDHTAYGRLVGPSPLVLRASREQIEALDANMTGICEGEIAPSGTPGIYSENPDDYCRPALAEEGGELWARIFVSGQKVADNPTGGTVRGPAFAFQQEYHVIVTLFYHSPACADYSVFLGNVCDQEPVAVEGNMTA